MEKLSFVLGFVVLLFFSQSHAQEIHIEETSALVLDAPTELSLKNNWKKAYFRKLRAVSPRIAYGIGSFEASMRYEVPDIQGTLKDAANQLDKQFAWIPWNQLDVQPAETHRIKTLRKTGNFFVTGGINLPIFFLDIEAGIGRFSEPLITLKEVFPLRESLSTEGVGTLMNKRIRTPREKSSLNLRLGVELERLLPDHLLPRLSFSDFCVGVDGAAYYLLGGDFSYRVGFEAFGNEALEKIHKVFEPIPLISNKKKEQAANALLGHMESQIPAYLWPPAFQGYGLTAKVYFDIGKRFRIAGTYTHEKSYGLKFKSAEWLNQGPQIWRNFYTLRLESKL